MRLVLRNTLAQTKQLPKLEPKIGIIGFGGMGSAIACGLVMASRFDVHEIIILDRNQSKLEQINSSFKFAKADSYKDLLNLEKLIIAVKPKDIDEALKGLEGLSTETILVSIAAGTKLAKFESRFPENPIVRVMPNTPSQIGKGVSVLAPNKNVTNDQLKNTQAIFDTLGVSLVVMEDQLDAVTALSGSGPAYFFLMIEAMIDAGIKLGLDAEVAKKLAVGTAYGSAALAMESHESPSDLREKVTSPGGTTEAALKIFESKKYRQIVAEAITAAYKRGQELSN